MSLNGRLTPAGRAAVSPFDRGLIYGDGIFETVRAYGGRLFQIERHLGRLAQSARALELILPFNPRRLRHHMEQLLTINRLRNAIVRVTVTRGVGPMAIDPPARAHPTVVIFARPFTGHPRARYRRGLQVIIAKVRKVPAAAAPPHAKNLNYIVSMLAKREATQRRADDALLLNTAGRLCEGATSNLFFVRGGALCTPSPDTGLLEGITRQVVMDLAREARMRVREGRFTARHLTAASEAFLTNTSYELMPVVRIGEHRIGSGRPGPVTKRLHDLFIQLRRS